MTGLTDEIREWAKRTGIEVTEEVETAWGQLDLLDTLEDVISQACGACGPGGQGNLDSMALSSYANGIRVLAAHGRVRIIEEVGRRVIAEWVVREEEPPKHYCQDRHISGFLCDLEEGHLGSHRTGTVEFGS